MPKYAIFSKEDGYDKQFEKFVICESQNEADKIAEDFNPCQCEPDCQCDEDDEGDCYCETNCSCESWAQEVPMDKVFYETEMEEFFTKKEQVEYHIKNIIYDELWIEKTIEGLESDQQKFSDKIRHYANTLESTKIKKEELLKQLKEM